MRSSDLGNSAVISKKLSADAVTGEKVAANTLSGADINYGSHVVFVGNAEGADGAIAPCPAGEIATGGGRTASMRPTPGHC